MAGSGRRHADAALIAALAGGATMADAARAAGVGERTVYRRLQTPAFRARVIAARADLVERAAARLADAAGAAVTTLGELLVAGTPPAVRLGAARAVLELGLRLREQQEIEERLAALEAALAEVPSMAERGQPWPRPA